MRRGANPHAAKTDLQPADEVQLLHENVALVEFAVTVLVFEHENLVTALAFGGALRISMPLGDPQSAAVIDAERDGLLNVRFASKELRRKSGAQRHLFGGLFPG